MKISFALTATIKDELAKHRVFPSGKTIEVDGTSFRHFKSMIDAGGYSHLSEAEREVIAIGCCYTHPDHRERHLEPMRGPIKRAGRNVARSLTGNVSYKFYETFLFRIIVVILLVLIVAMQAKCQVPSQITVIKFTDSAGTQVKSYVAPFTIKCGSNMTCTASGSILTMQPSAGGGGGYATIQNATVAIAQRLVVNMLGGLSCADNAGNLSSDCQLSANAAVASQYLTGIDASGNFIRKQIAYSELSGIPGTFASTAHNLLSATHGDTTAGVVVRGDVITGQGASPKWVRLPKGSATNVLKMDNSAVDVLWGQVDFSELSSIPQFAQAFTPILRNWLTGFNASNGLFSSSQPASTDLSDFSTTAPSTAGQLPIFDGSKYVPGDPIVQGTQAAGSAVQPSPMVGGGWDGTNVRALKTASDGTLQIGGTITATLPTQPFLNVTDFNDVVASSPTRGDLIVANSTPKYAKFAKGTQYQTLQGGASDLLWDAIHLDQASAVTGVLPTANIANPITSTLNATGCTGLPALVGSPGFICQGSFPNSIASYIGDGSGFSEKWFSRTGSVNTTLMTLNDTAPNLVPQTLKVPGLATLTTLNTAAYIFVDQIAGADFGAKMTACDAALVALGGGICDARSITGAQSAASTITISTNNVKHLLGEISLTLAASPGINWTADGSTWEGISRGATDMKTSSGTADLMLITSTGALNVFSDFNVQSTVTRTAGACLHIQGGNNSFQRLAVYQCFDGIKMDTITTGANNSFYDILASANTGAGATTHCTVLIGGVASGNVASEILSGLHFLNSGSSPTDAQICIQDGADSITISDSQIVANAGGSDAVGIHLERVNAGNPPSNIRIMDTSFEGGATKAAVVIDSAFGVEFTGSTAQSSLQGVQVNAGTRVKWNGGLLYNNQQEGIRLANLAVTDFQVLGARFCNNGLGTTNTFSDFFAVAATTGFAVQDNRFLACNAGGNAPKNNIEIAAGASNNYSITGNSFASSTGAAILDGGTGLVKLISNVGTGTTFDNFANLYGQADIVADSGAINTTETIIVKTPALPANRLIAGTHIRMTLTGTCTASAANTSTFTIRMGTLGTTGDTAIATPVTAVSAVTGTSIPFKAVFDFTIRTTGASGTGFITMELVNQGITGISTLGDQIIMPTMSAFNTTTASNIMSVSYKSAATTTTSTFKNAVIEIVQN